jgi:hypothetical protein
MNDQNWTCGSIDLRILDARGARRPRFQRSRRDDLAGKLELEPGLVLPLVCAEGLAQRDRLLL